MDATEAAAVLTLGEKEVWSLDELPAAIDIGLLRCMDKEGLVEARAVGMRNQQSAPHDPPTWVPYRSAWHSPMRESTEIGTWDVVMQHRHRTQLDLPWEIHLSDSGQAELSRLRRRAPATGSEPPSVDAAAPVEMVSLGEYIERTIRLLDEAESARMAAEQSARIAVSEGRAAQLRADPTSVLGDVKPWVVKYTAFKAAAGRLISIAYGLHIEAAPLEDLIRTGDTRLVGDAVRVLRLAQAECARRTSDSTQHPSPPVNTEETDVLVTLDQAAAMVQQSKRTLERYLREEKLPAPDVRGGGGKPNRWYWSRVRPALMEQFRMALPERFSASRIV